MNDTQSSNFGRCPHGYISLANCLRCSIVISHNCHIHCHRHGIQNGIVCRICVAGKELDEIREREQAAKASITAHNEAAAVLLEKVVQKLRAGVASEDLGWEVRQIGTMMERRI